MAFFFFLCELSDFEMRLLVLLSCATLAWSFVPTPVSRFQPASKLTSGLGERKDHLSHISVSSSKKGKKSTPFIEIARRLQTIVILMLYPIILIYG